MNKNLNTILLIAICVIVIIVGIKISRKPTDDFPNLGAILTGPTVNGVIWIGNGTSSIQVLPARPNRAYASICLNATTTYALGGEIVTLFVATSTESATSTGAESAVGPFITVGPRNASYILTYEERCQDFVQGVNMTNREVFAISTTTVDFSRINFVTVIDQ